MATTVMRCVWAVAYVACASGLLAAEGDWAARVNGHVISPAELDRAVADVLGPRKLDAAALATLRQTTLAALVNRRLAWEEITRQSRAASAREIDAELANLRREVESRKETWAEYLRSERLNEAELRQAVAWRITWQRYLHEELTDTALATYFERHRRHFDGTRLRLRQILWRRPTATKESNAHASDATLVRQASDVRAQIKSGKLSFADAVKKHSAAPSKAADGDLGFVSRRGENVEEFSRAAFALNPGELSPPIVTRFGVHLLECTAIEPGTKRWTDVRDALQAAAAAERFHSLAEKSRPTGRIEIK